jgi:plasmid stability protein
MSGLLLKNIPPDLHEKLRARARLNRRSLSAEAITILERALTVRRRPTLEEIDARRVKPKTPMTDEFLDMAKRTGRP